MFRDKKILIPGIIAFVMLILAFAFYLMAVNSQQAELDKANAKYTQLTNKKSMLVAALKKNNNEAIRSGTGMDAARKLKDDAAGEELAKLVTTWDSKKSYDAARKEVMKKYKVKEDSAFMKTFMPPVVEINSATGTGTTNEIDATGTNVSYKDMSSYVTKISGDKYTYLTIVSVSSSDRAGNTAEKKMMFIYTTDANHNLTDISGYNVAR